MKHFVLSFLTLIFFYQAQAQITITDADMPQVNEFNIMTQAPNILLADPSLTGTNYFWNYSFLKKETTYRDSFLTKFSPELAPYIVPYFDADFAQRGEAPLDISDFVPITFDNSYDFYRVSSDAFTYLGFGARVQGLPIPFRLIRQDVVYELPMTYGDSHVSESEWRVDLPTIAYWDRTQVRESTVEGWGRLLLPNGLYDVLKVRTVIRRSDTTYVDTLGFGLRVDQPPVVQYKWHAKGYMGPILTIEFQEILGVEIFQSAVYYNGSGPIHRVEDFASLGIKMYPNPAVDRVQLEFPEPSSGVAKLMDMQGKVVLEKSLQGIRKYPFELDGIAPGVYLLEWNDGEKNAVEKLIISSQ